MPDSGPLHPEFVSVDPLRIAYVINSFEGGGAALPLPDVVGELIASGAQVRVLALSRRDGRAAAALDRAGIEYRVCEGTGKRDHARSFVWLWREISAFGPTLIWTSLTQATVMGQVIGAARSIPVVSWQHNAFLKPANRAILRAMRGRAVLWLADSTSVAEHTHADLGVPRGSIRVWPLFRADASIPAAKGSGGAGRFRFGSLGRLHPNKGYDFLVEALAKVNASRPELAARIEVAIAGEGAQRDELVELARARGVTNLILRGFESDPRAFLDGLDAYLQPSRAEGLCIAAHEALQAGLPAIVSAVGEMQHTVRAGDAGEVVPVGDVDALAAAIVRLAEDPAAARRKGEAARAHVLDAYGSARFQQAGREIVATLRQTLARG